MRACVAPARSGRDSAMRRIVPEPLTAAAFAPFGDVLDASGAPDRIINQGLCGRFHDRARLDFGPDGRAGLSIFRAEARALPLRLDMVERHPEGSQAFIPMSADPFLVIVAPDVEGAPGAPRAFLTAPGQGVNFLRGTWHGVLTPLAPPGLFAVIDRIGGTPNLQEHWFDAPFEVALG
jgi:ureidoglycolate lyase